MSVSAAEVVVEAENGGVEMEIGGGVELVVVEVKVEVEVEVGTYFA